MRDAYARFLAPDACVIPCELEVHAVLVESEPLARLNSVVASVAGLQLRALNSFSQRTRAIRLAEFSHRFITRPRIVLRFRLGESELPPDAGQADVEMEVPEGGVAHAVVAWFVVHLDAETSISTAPGCGEPMRGYSWGQLCQVRRTC